MALSKEQSRKRIHQRIRKKISGTAEKPRLAVYRSNKAIYAQLINDVTATTIAAASSKECGATGAKVEQAKAVGKLIAEKASSNNISAVVFDRGGYLYHGRVKALADGAREAGLAF
ncbi:MAG: 50S ribosomal protein L18 [Saprospiraceae bacterium]